MPSSQRSPLEPARGYRRGGGNAVLRRAPPPDLVLWVAVAIACAAAAGLGYVAWTAPPARRSPGSRPSPPAPCWRCSRSRCFRRRTTRRGPSGLLTVLGFALAYLLDALSPSAGRSRTSSSTTRPPTSASWRQAAGVELRALALANLDRAAEPVAERQGRGSGRLIFRDPRPGRRTARGPPGLLVLPGPAVLRSGEGRARPPRPANPTAHRRTPPPLRPGGTQVSSGS